MLIKHILAIMMLILPTILLDQTGKRPKSFNSNPGNEEMEKAITNSFSQKLLEESGIEQ